MPTSAGDVDLARLIEQKQQLIDDLVATKYVDVADAHGFPIRHGHARFVDERTLEVDEEPLQAPAYVVATGVTARTSDLPGLDGVDHEPQRDGAAEPAALPGRRRWRVRRA